MELALVQHGNFKIKPKQLNMNTISNEVIGTAKKFGARIIDLKHPLKSNNLMASSALDQLQELKPLIG